MYFLQCISYNVQCISGTAAGSHEFQYIRAMSNESVKVKEFLYSNESENKTSSVYFHWLYYWLLNHCICKI